MDVCTLARRHTKYCTYKYLPRSDSPGVGRGQGAGGTEVPCEPQQRQPPALTLEAPNFTTVLYWWWCRGLRLGAREGGGPVCLAIAV